MLHYQLTLWSTWVKGQTLTNPNNNQPRRVDPFSSLAQLRVTQTPKNFRLGACSCQDSHPCVLGFSPYHFHVISCNAHMLRKLITQRALLMKCLIYSQSPIQENNLSMWLASSRSFTVLTGAITDKMWSLIDKIRGLLLENHWFTPFLVGYGLE